MGARQDAGRTGFLGGGTLARPPLTRRWTAPLGDQNSAPLVVGDRVFIARQKSEAVGSRIDAYDVLTGTRIWAHTVQSPTGLAYGGGRVVALSGSGAVLALDAADGATVWAAEVGPRDDTDIVIDHGLVFIGSASTYDVPGARALRLSDGKPAWRTPGYSRGPMAIAGGLALQSDACGTRGWIAATGERAFDRSAYCYSYGSGVAASAGGPVVASEWQGRILDISGGETRDTVPFTGQPALAGDVLVTTSRSEVEARSLRSGVSLWSSDDLPSFYDAGSPTIVDGVVYVARTSGKLQALDLDTGSELWSDSIAPSAGWHESEAQHVRIAAGAGTLAVANGHELIVYGGAGPSLGAGLRVTSGPEGPTQDADAAFAFTAPVAPTQCRLDNGAWVACAGSAGYPALAEGPHTFSVRAVADGQVVGLAHRGFSVDRTAPETTITAGPAGTTGGSYYYVPSFSFAVAGGPRASECRMDGGAWSPCLEQVTYDSLDDGAHTFAVRSSDVAGNVEDPPQTRSFTLDRTAPVVTIVSKPEQTTRRTDARVEFRVNEPAHHHLPVGRRRPRGLHVAGHPRRPRRGRPRPGHPRHRRRRQLALGVRELGRGHPGAADRDPRRALWHDHGQLGLRDVPH